MGSEFCLALVGQIDAHRATRLVHNVLTAITENRATEVIIDITGVPFVDSYVAKSLVQTGWSARLLGVECTLVGISAEVAQTLVHLGVDLTMVWTFSLRFRGGSGSGDGAPALPHCLDREPGMAGVRRGRGKRL